MAFSAGMADFGDIHPGARLVASGEEFEIGNELGRGTAARVFACRRLSDGAQLAMKAIDLRRLRLQDDFEGQMVKLNREIQILQELDHKRIVSLRTAHRTDNWCLLFMELISGGELFNEIVQKKCFSEVEARHVFRQILDAVAYMHSRHVIHRDLKPENILIERKVPGMPPSTGDVYDIKIADFGLSKIISEGMSAAKTFLGTPQYWAPEVLDVERKGGTYDKSADFWSLGAILFVMLGGRYPFDGKKMPLEEQIRTASFNMGTAAWKHISDEAKDLVRGLLRVEVSTRFDMERCLAHPWVAGPGAAHAEPDSGPMHREPVVAEVEGVSGVPVDVVVLPVVARPIVEEARSTGSDQPSPEQASRGPAAAQNVIFGFSELLNLQVSIAASLEMACLAFRHTDPVLAEDIRQIFRQARDLSQHAETVVCSYAQTAEQVSRDVLPDLQLAIQEKEASLAVGFLGMVQEWVTNMKREGVEMQARYARLQENVYKLTVRAQRSRARDDRRSADSELADAVEVRDVAAGALWLSSPQSRPLAIEADAGVAPGPPISGPAESQSLQDDCMNTLTRKMFDRFNTLAQCRGDTPMLELPAEGASREVVAANGVSADAWKHDLLELLFMAPGVDVSLLPSMEPFNAATASLPRVESVHSHGNCSEPASIAPMVVCAPDSSSASALASAHSSAALLRALQELKRVDKILYGCSAFWAHMDLTVQKLSQMKEHTELLIKFAGSSKPLRDRFDQRLGEYSNFWSSLERLCRSYCAEHQTASKNMYQFIDNVDHVSDIVDTVSSGRLGMASLRPGKQSRHKM